MATYQNIVQNDMEPDVKCLQSGGNELVALGFLHVNETRGRNLASDRLCSMYLSSANISHTFIT